MGGIFLQNSIPTVSDDLTIRTIPAPARCFFAWISFFVVTIKAYILQVVLIETDLRIITVDIIQPHTEVMDDVPRFLVTQFTDTTIDSHTLIYVCLPSSEPGSTLIELLLIHRRSTSLSVIPPPTTSGVFYTGI